MAAWVAAVGPWLALVALALHLAGQWRWVIEGVLLGIALGWRSLEEHVRAVAIPLLAADLPAARAAVARIVSRDAAMLDGAGVSVAATESALENGHDAVIAPLVWFALAGGIGVVLHRLANTLDAMWGYRNPRYLRFGWAAARADDVIGWVSARVTALAYALAGHTTPALWCWRHQAPAWPSPNAGPVMASGAGALGVQVGGAAPYDGQWEDRPLLGQGEPPRPETPLAALALLERAAWGVVAIVALVLVLRA